jgi:DeoR/GlpR family transcriptional regulator of sugar metabolism
VTNNKSKRKKLKINKNSAILKALTEKGRITLYAAERQAYIQKQLEEQGSVSVSTLAAKLAVSAVTIRHDLAQMEADGLLRRTFGGAVGRQLPVLSYAEKSSRNLAAKKAIAAAASKLLEPGMSVFVDAGTTTMQLAPYLQACPNLRLFTVDLHLALKLANDQMKLDLIGGPISTKTLSVDGAPAALAISQLHFDLAFLGCDAFDYQQVETASANKAALKRAAMMAAQQQVVLADQSKAAGHAVHAFAKMSDLTYLVTNYRPDIQVPAAVAGKVILGGK